MECAGKKRKSKTHQSLDLAKSQIPKAAFFAHHGPQPGWQSLPSVPVQLAHSKILGAAVTCGRNDGPLTAELQAFFRFSRSSQHPEVSPAPLPASFVYYSERAANKSTAFFFRIYYLASDNALSPSINCNYFKQRFSRCSIAAF
jgi:hypothetical protein